MKILQSLIVFFLLGQAFLGAQSEIKRIEPPFWWAGMSNPSLQLMVYGHEIGELQVQTDYPGVRIDSIIRPDNNNYLFVDLHLQKDLEPGTMKLQFYRNEALVYESDYAIMNRRKGSAERNSFGTQDVMYLITPDRFANGDTSNDEILGLKDGYNRSAPYGRHGGDLQGIIDHLDYIEDMGFTAVWLNPVLENDQEKWSYHGYATTDYYKVDPRLGTNEKYVELSRKASGKGMGLIMDIIVNHCGSDHWWMADPPFEDWINYQEEGFQSTNHRKTTLVDPYAAESDRSRMVKGWFVKSMPDLNQKNPFMSKYLIQNSIWWIEYADLYGIRQDTYSYPYREFMTDWTCAIRSEYPHFNIVGEEWIEEPAVISYWQEGKVNHDGYISCLSGLMDFPLCFNLHRALRDEEKWGSGLHLLYETLAMDFLYADPSSLVIFADNHDMSRVLTQLGEDRKLTKMALTFLLTTRGIPQIFYGTEILMSNQGTDSHGVIRSDFPGGWKNDGMNAFEGSGLTDDAKEMQTWLKMLLHWRREKAVIHSGKLLHYAPEDGVYVFFRHNDKEAVMVVLNKNTDEVEIELSRFNQPLAGFKNLKNIENCKISPVSDKLKLEAKHATIFELFK